MTGYWPGNVTVYGREGELVILSTFEVLGFMVSRRALEACQVWPEVNLDPFWDSSNYTAHFNSLATALALYESGFYIAADQRHKIYERREEADENSEVARGIADHEWKHVKGLADRGEWLARAFPQYQGDPKYVRRQIQRRIVKEIMKRFPAFKPDLNQLSLVERLRYRARRVW